MTQEERERLRKELADKLRLLFDKQAEKSAAWLRVVTKHAAASGSIVANVIETGKINFGEILADTAAMSFECISEGFGLMLGGLPSQSSGAIDIFHDNVDEDAETVGPFKLSGVSAADLPNIVAGPLVRNGGNETLAVDKSVLDGSVYVSVSDLRPGDAPRPVGIYTGSVIQNVAGRPAKLLAQIALTRV